MTRSPDPEQVFHILLVEADAADRQRILRAFEQHDRAHAASTGHRSQLAAVSSLSAARQALQDLNPDLVISNTQLPDGEGMALIPTRGEPSYAVILTSSQPGEAQAVSAIKAGAIDYLVISGDSVNELPEHADRALQEWQFMLEHERLQHEVAELSQRQQELLGQELHDGLGQQLTGLGLLARSLKKRLSGASREDLDMAEQLVRGLDQALADVRSLSHGLLPVPMDARGLVSAIEELTRRVSKQSGIRIELIHEKPILISNNEIATHVYRIVQEAINNAIKHARAKQITLILEADEHQAVIEVCDDGTGLPDNLDRHQGLGFRTMFHRCKLFGGSLDIFTHDQGGTRVRCRFPLDHYRRPAQ